MVVIAFHHLNIARGKSEATQSCAGCILNPCQVVEWRCISVHNTLQSFAAAWGHQQTRNHSRVHSELPAVAAQFTTLSDLLLCQCLLNLQSCDSPSNVETVNEKLSETTTSSTTIVRVHRSVHGLVVIPQWESQYRVVRDRRLLCPYLYHDGHILYN